MSSCVKQLRNEYSYERTRLISLCEKWQHILDSSGRPSYSEDTKGAILSVIGQTKLLLTKKLKQFEGLLLERENSGGDSRQIRDSDLRGFWEMVMIQVDIMVSKFKELEDLIQEEAGSPRTWRRRTRMGWWNSNRNDAMLSFPGKEQQISAQDCPEALLSSKISRPMTEDLPKCTFTQLKDVMKIYLTFQKVKIV